MTALKHLGVVPFITLLHIVSPAAELPKECGVGTYSRMLQVKSASELTSALSQVQAGDLIRLADGVYSGNFVASNSGTSSAMITLCGGRSAILDGVHQTKGYTFHLKANHWRVTGFSITRGKNGIILDQANHNTLENLAVYNTGNEAVHLRTHSSNNLVQGNEVSHAGKYKPEYGEGIYIGSAKSNWCDYTNCEADKSDNNKIIGNKIFANAAEAIDLKEGTTNTLIQGNSFDGTDITGANYADSWIDVKGNDVLIRDNTGQNTGDILLDGYQTHVVLAGWGERIVFANNKSTLNGKGYGINVNKSKDVTVYCDNHVVGADLGLSNVTCTPVPVTPPAEEVVANTNIASVSRVVFATQMRDDHPIEKLFDRCSKDDASCMAGTNAGSVMEVEMDFQVLHSIGSVKLFGDANGGWVSKTFDVEYKVLPTDKYVVFAKDIPAFKNEWITQSTKGLKARYIRVRVLGDASKNSVQARELEVWGKPVDTRAPASEPSPTPAPVTDVAVLPLNSSTSTYPGTVVKDIKVRYFADQKYDSYDETKFDIFTIDPSQKKKTPLVLYVHGGGFKSGDKSDSHGQAKNYLAKGVAYATINYRLLSSAPVAGRDLLLCLNDSRRALQFIRHYAEAFNIDTNKIVLIGSSAGASTVLWVGLQNDMKLASSADPVLRQSTRVAAIAVSSTQATLDVYRWGADAEFQGLYKEGSANGKALLKNASLFYGYPTGFSSTSQFLQEPWVALRSKLDVINFMDSSDPEIYAESSADTSDVLHNYYHVDRLYSAAAERGVKGVFKTPKASKTLPAGGVVDSSLLNFILRKVGQ